MSIQVDFEQHRINIPPLYEHVFFLTSMTYLHIFMPSRHHWNIQLQEHFQCYIFAKDFKTLLYFVYFHPSNFRTCFCFFHILHPRQNLYHFLKNWYCWSIIFKELLFHNTVDKEEWSYLSHSIECVKYTIIMLDQNLKLQLWELRWDHMLRR